MNSNRLVMKSYECEVRYFIKDINSFEKRLEELEAKKLSSYEFTDYYFKPKNYEWNPLEKNLRIQVSTEGSTIYFSKYEIVEAEGIKFKRSVYPQGKIPLFTGSFDFCKSLLKDLGFEHWLTVKKRNAKVWDIKKYGFATAVEYVDSIGWIGELEFEGKDIKKAGRNIRNALKILEIEKELVSFKPLSVIFAEEKGLI